MPAGATGATGAAAGKYDAIILAVAHNQFKELNYKALLAPNGVALVTVSVTAENLIVSSDELLANLRSVPGVINVDIMAG